MGWKSTADITREQAIALILTKLLGENNCYTNNKLEEILDNMGFGDDPNLPYFGYNFNIVDKKDEHPEI